MEIIFLIAILHWILEVVFFIELRRSSIRDNINRKNEELFFEEDWWNKL